MLTAQTINREVLSWPGIQITWAPYDPTDLFSESIDPLGFGKGYIELADHLLPGLTTITVVPRYLSMLCAGIDAALKRCPLGSGGDEHKKRLSHLAAYERAWALACTVASQNGLGDSAILGVRGVRSVQRYLLTVGTADRYRTTFNLLSNQIRSGGIGAYASMLAECRLADMQNLTLRPLGVELAQAFPSAGRLDVCADDGDFSKSALREWGGRANPSCITAEESRLLQIALSGEREGGHPDRLRWTALRMLALLPQEAESRLFGEWIKSFRHGELVRRTMPSNCVAEVQCTLPVLVAFEKLYQTALYVFELTRATCTDQVEVSLSALSAADRVIAATEQVKRRARALMHAVVASRKIDHPTSMLIDKAFAASGLTKFAMDVAQAGGSTMVKVILARHMDVQAGKFDGAIRKAPWICESNGRVRLTAQRHRLPLTKVPLSWSGIGWHPYRTEAAYNFLRACGMVR